MHGRGFDLLLPGVEPGDDVLGPGFPRLDRFTPTIILLSPPSTHHPLSTNT